MGLFIKPITSSMFKALVTLMVVLAVVSAETPVFTLVPNMFQARSHYGNPMPSGCLSDEIAARIQGANGDACFPRATNNRCPTDLPSGTTATPMAVIQDQTGARYCGLICSGVATGTCPSGASCVAASGYRLLTSGAGVGLCMYS